MTSSEHEPERELQELQDQSDSLGGRISDARDDWESKKSDASVPGAGGDPLAARSDHAEEQFPAQGSSDELGEDLDQVDASENLDDRDPANEDL